MLINDKVDAVYIPDSPSRIKATDYNQIKNEIQECITEAGLTPTKDVIQLPQALKILTAQSGAEEVAKIEAAGQEQLNAINTAGAQAVQDAQDAANTATSKATEAAGSATEAAASAAQAQQSAQGAASSAEASSSSASAAQTSETAAQGYSANADAKAAQAQNYAQAAQTSAADALSSAQDAAQSAQNSRGLAVGTVYYSQSSLATDNPGALPLWTGEYYANGAALYPDFYAWVKRHTELCTTKADYDARLAQYGEVPFYVVDEAAGSLRLPKLSNYIKMASSAQGITQTNAGLPNITGQVAIYIRAQKGRGAFSTPSDSASNAAEVGRVTLNDEGTTAFFDASKSNAIYGASDSVTPAHTTLYPWVYAFNAAVPASTAQAAEFQQGLSGKADTNLGNVPSNYDYVVESYRTPDGNSWYEVWKSDKVIQGGLATVSGTVGATVTLLKPFANTAYNIQLTLQTTNAVVYLPDTAQSISIANSKTTTSFGVQTAGIMNYEINGISWRAEGQGA